MLSRETIQNIQYIKVTSGMLEDIDFTPNPLFTIKAAQLKAEKDAEQSETPTQSDNVKIIPRHRHSVFRWGLQSDNQVNTKSQDDDNPQVSADKSPDLDEGYDTQQANNTQMMIDKASKLTTKANSVKTNSTTKPHYDDYTD